MTPIPDGGRIVEYHCDDCGHVDHPNQGDHGAPTCPSCGRTVEQVSTDGAGSVKDHDHDLRKEHVGPPRENALGEVHVEIWVGCRDEDCAGYWTGDATLTIDVDSSDVEEVA